MKQNQRSSFFRSREVSLGPLSNTKEKGEKRSWFMITNLSGYIVDGGETKHAVKKKKRLDEIMGDITSPLVRRLALFLDLVSIYRSYDVPTNM